LDASLNNHISKKAPAAHAADASLVTMFFIAY